MKRVLTLCFTMCVMAAFGIGYMSMLIKEKPKSDLVPVTGIFYEYTDTYSIKVNEKVYSGPLSVKPDQVLTEGKSVITIFVDSDKVYEEEYYAFYVIALWLLVFTCGGFLLMILFIINPRLLKDYVKC